MTPLYSYNFLTEKLNFTHLDPAEDSESISAMALGGVHGEITVEEMTAAFQIFGNGGVYHEPYMYFYVEDHDGNVILDNRDKSGRTSHLLRNSDHHAETSAKCRLQHEPMGVLPLTWAFPMNGTPLVKPVRRISMITPGLLPAHHTGVAGIWTGTTSQRRFPTQHPKRLWLAIMEQVLEGVNWDDYAYVLDSDVVSATFCYGNGTARRNALY